MQQPGTQSPSSPPAQVPAVRASDQERDAATQQLQQAFAEGRLDDTEFDGRMRTALTARPRAALDALLADLPAAGPASQPLDGPATAPGRLAGAVKGPGRRARRRRGPPREPR